MGTTASRGGWRWRCKLRKCDVYAWGMILPERCPRWLPQKTGGIQVTYPSASFNSLIQHFSSSFTRFLPNVPVFLSFFLLSYQCYSATPGSDGFTTYTQSSYSQIKSNRRISSTMSSATPNGSAVNGQSDIYDHSKVAQFIGKFRRHGSKVFSDRQPLPRIDRSI